MEVYLVMQGINGTDEHPALPLKAEAILLSRLSDPRRISRVTEVRAVGQMDT